MDTENNKVVGKLMGGLGNQLFIIFATYAHAIKTDSRPLIITNKPSDRKTYFDTVLYKNIEKIENSEFEQVRDNHHHSYRALPCKPNIILYGFFQSYKYFIDYFEEILKRLDFIELRKNIMKKYKNYLNFDTTMHFRLGDYKKQEYNHPICDIKYYINCLDKLKEDSKILFFYEKSDENTVLEKIFLLRLQFKKMLFHPINTDIVDYEQLFIMSSVKINIISNSTFSLWAAYLNDNIDKIVYYPSVWFGKNISFKNTSDMFPEKYIKIDY